MFERFISKLSLRAKLFVLIGAFAVPLAGLLWYSGSNIKSTIEMTAKEIEGTIELKEMYKEVVGSLSNEELKAFDDRVHQISSEYGIILDAEFDTYHMQQAVTEYTTDIFVEFGHIQKRERDELRTTQIELIRNHLLPKLTDSVRDAAELNLTSDWRSTKLHKIAEEVYMLGKDISLGLQKLEAKDLDQASLEVLQSKIKNLSIVLLDELEHLLLLRHSTKERSLNVMIGCTVLALLVLSFLSFVIVRNINQRLLNVMNVMALAGTQGDLKSTVQDEGSDEIHELALCMNQMVANIRTVLLQIAESGSLVHRSTVEIAASSKQQQATSSEIAATSAQIEATSKRISSTAENLSSTMLEVQEIATQTGTLANEGHTNLARMRQTMHGINEACQAISRKLEALNQKAARIGDVVTTIAKVADQTNLLSLNAAIEAEKAGEFGHGFSVVAREIRRLADQTAVATVDIEQMVKEIQGAVASGVMGMEKFASDVRQGANEVENAGEQISLVIGQIQTLTPSFHTVTEGMQHQALSAKQITEGLSQLSTAVRQTADSLTQSNISIDQLHQATVILEKEVNRFSTKN